MKEKWNPLKRVAEAAGGVWPDITDRLIERDLNEAEMEREDGLMKLPPQMVLLTDLYKVWPAEEPFVSARELVRLLIAANPDYWDVSSAYGRSLTVQRLGRILAQVKVRSSKDSKDHRGYQQAQFEIAWRQSGITPRSEPSKPSEASKPSAVEPEVSNEHPESDLPKLNAPCPTCGQPSHWANAANDYIHPGCEPTPTTRTEHN